ncbi:MORC family CW-type zinc finger protein 1 [Mus musculus]|uniref:MORC family CW-type zinc finger protein 1 n=1 Tax=Mus musculus TaxID=10090 RepID=MORC1_MOUSE|nr:MORC family CW-type zinc finger protein 1 [Mus musculus]Q9WVL5.1 RecName: Full=MORC family CW-type zinc finger protein 1; AltName: Full=Protein microrchidia [Mus musculus]AAD43003.1 microrchidia [Mus musculus]AAH30893.1 Microrchidia 1 [Mus musculus]EDK98094.1 microrchidia 1 [Mus musculus]|eukprot:NP_034946.1 MORC family CW-type zinc finger protein 1 [Mus musculus]
MDKYALLQRAKLHLDFIHANSTTHSFLFGALAELLDNARDAGAVRLDVFSVDNETLQGGFMLCFLDDGCGMSPDEASDVIYFGTSKKRLSTLKFIGQYGNGLKSGSMRIGKDCILFTKKEETMTCLFFSQTFCEKEGLTEVVVPIPSWLTRTRESITDDPQKFFTELSIIFKYSPFKTEAELMQQFDMIYGRCGTLLIIYNLKLLLSGEPELDVTTDKEDILMAEAPEEIPERRSFRAYTAVLYFEPRMKIFIQAKRVQTKHLCYSLYKPRKYQYTTSSFKGKFKTEVQKAEEAVKRAELLFKEVQAKVNQPDRIALSSTQDALQKALQDVDTKHKSLRQKQRALRKARTLSLFFGVNTEDQHQAGMFIYSNNRLIKMYEKVGPQLKMKSLLGAGIIGIVNIPLETMEPSHNKQEFLNVQEYNHLLKVMGQYLIQYCKDIGISNRNLTLFWDEFKYQHSKDTDSSLESLQWRRRQAMGIPFILQCDLCLKWRVLPSSSNYQEKGLPDLWICASNPNNLENSCNQIERLPSIPLGTVNRRPPSKDERERQLQESVQRYQDKLVEAQPQKSQLIVTSKIPEFKSSCLSSALKEKSKLGRIQPSGADLTQGSPSSVKLSFMQRSQKRSTEDTHSDVEFICMTKIPKKSVKKTVKYLQPGHAPALLENLKLEDTAQVSSREIKKQQSESLVQAGKASTDVASSRDPTVTMVWDQSSTKVSLKQEEEEEVPLIKPDKQELCDDTPVVKGNSSALHWKSLPGVQMEDLSPRSGHKINSVSGDCQLPASPMPSQSMSVEETARKLLSNLREILLYFVPEFQLSSEFECTSVEELITNPELERCPENINEKLKTCFNQIQNIYMAQYEKRLKRKMQSIVYEANRRGLLNQVFLGQCELKRKRTEEKLSDLRAKLALLLQKLQLGGPAGDPQQIDAYLEDLLKEDRLPTALHEKSPESA